MQQAERPRPVPAGRGRVAARLRRSAAGRLFVAAGVLVAVTACSSDGSDPGSAEPVEWVALGDSFSSGDGPVPASGWLDDTDCNRSPTAYALRAADLLRAEGIEIASLAFVACSGAEAREVTTEQAGAITDATTLVTVTVGGNDVGFAELIVGCLAARLADQLPVLSPLGLTTCPVADDVWAARLAEMGTRVGDTLDDVLARLGDEATVIVLGYPNLTPETPSTPCEFGTEQARAGRRYVADIDATLRRVVSDIDDPRLRYVDVVDRFAGHALCDEQEPWFYDIVWVHPVGSFHPNDEGQAVYAEVLAGYLLDHVLDGRGA